jgi:hypothetical protein
VFPTNDIEKRRGTPFSLDGPHFIGLSNHPIVRIEKGQVDGALTQVYLK